MLGELVAGQFALESALAEVSNADPAARDQLRSQLSLIAGLRQQIGTANGSGLTLLRGEVTALAGNAAAAAQEARTSASASAASANSITTLANASRQQTAAVMAGMKDFDADLKFGPGDTEAEYRQREAERRAYIAAEQAKGTPQGDLNASGAAVGQMADAAAHGAGDNPEFQKRWDKLTASTEALRAQLVRDGGNVAEFDAHLRDDLRQIMKSKGIPDAKIDALLADHSGNPLDAVKEFVAEQKGIVGDKEIGDLSRKARSYKDDVENEQATVASTTATPAASVPALALDAIAGLKAAGVMVGEHDASTPPAHGVTIIAQPTPNQSIGARS